MSGGVTAILLAAGSSSRMGFDKLTLPLAGRTALEYALLAFLRADVTDFLIAVSDATRPLAQSLVERYGKAGPRIRLVEGGAARGESVYNALLLAEGEIVAIHDVARCLVEPSVILDSIAGALARGSGVTALPPRDTIWQGEAAVLERDTLLAAQTPQSFGRARILAAYEAARQAGICATDDAAIYRRAYGEVHFTPGSPRNQKLTTPADIPLFEALLRSRAHRSGFGEDTHRLVEGRALVLGGAKIPFELGLLGHSDADVLAHAVIDALLGAAALGDIGSHFPDSDPRYKGICSLELLAAVNGLLREKGYLLGNLDATIVAQQPKLAPYIGAMRQNLAHTLCCDVARVSVKATTPEGCGPEGELICITARCVCSLEEYQP
ncbi:MAG: 2-C-methyl-D-erythritol 2,4-cyclodiphosphate synthase [Candidatus Pelethousia sp.]|nr:2-C-methyl-D-erythritol 2,4-cyclodiphosphate synthase [Candidatus Pelethousia sp.]